MLWCKSTFLSHFSDEHCRLFPTQQQLFDFIDEANKKPTNEHYNNNDINNNNKQEEEEQYINEWLPFGIEFPSEEEVVRTLSSRSLRAASLINNNNTINNNSNSTINSNSNSNTVNRNAYPHRHSTGISLFRKRPLSPPSSLLLQEEEQKTEEKEEEEKEKERKDIHKSITTTSSIQRGQQKRAVREDYALLYGATSLSMQTRMFLATTRIGLIALINRIESQQLHLYEVIRDATPCHFYLDVEREKDYSAWHTVVDITDLNSDSNSDNSDSDINNNNNSNNNNNNEKDVESIQAYKYCCNTAEYTKSLEKAKWRPLRCCPWNCPLRAENIHTRDVLLMELRTFLHSVYPELFSSTDKGKEEEEDTNINNNNNNNDNIINSDSNNSDSDSDGNNINNSDIGLGNDVEVIVMRSRTPSASQQTPDSIYNMNSNNNINNNNNNNDNNNNEKFSQHYVIKFPKRWFRSNAHVGRVVNQFVDYLYERAAVDAQIHTALFYHDPPKQFPVLPPNQTRETSIEIEITKETSIEIEASSLCLPFLPLRCVIDTAVYSRNRMLRCFGSCKLHKKSVLEWEIAFPLNNNTNTINTTNSNSNSINSNSNSNNEDIEKKERERLVRFFSSLVSLPQGHRSLIHIPTVTNTINTTNTTNSNIMITNNINQNIMESSSSSYSHSYSYMNGESPTSPPPLRLLNPMECEKYTTLTSYITQMWNNVSGGKSCYINHRSIRQLNNGRYLLLLIEGSRYCECVRREHRSNHVYISVDLKLGVWVQKCFDPDCLMFRSKPRSIPSSLLLSLLEEENKEKEKEKKSDCLNKTTQEAALAKHAALRTVFRPS